MAKTPFTDLKSEDILSAHITGVQHAVNKLETVLNLKSAAITGLTLTAVADQQDASLHRLIYEGSIRNWLAAPAPVIKRNGTVVPVSEYKIQPAYGVVVFKTPQSVTDVITADVTHVTEASDVLEGLDKRVVTLENTSGGGGGGTTASIIGYSSGGDKFDTDGTYTIQAGDVYLTHSAKTAPTLVPDIGAGANTIDAFPFVVTQRTIIDKVKVEVTKQNFAGAKGMIGIYTSANGLPHKRLDYTDAYDETVGVIEKALKGGDLVLEAGVYWIGRFSSAGTQYRALNAADATKLNLPVGLPTDIRAPETKAAGIRTSWANNSVMPADYPAGGKAFARDQYCSPFYHIKKSY